MKIYYSYISVNAALDSQFFNPGTRVEKCPGMPIFIFNSGQVERVANLTCRPDVQQTVGTGYENETRVIRG